MKLDDYQFSAMTTAIYPGQGLSPLYPIMGVADEAGELLGKMKKIVRGDKELNSLTKLEMMYECGDVLWYLAVTAKELGFTLSEVARANLEKLAQRMKNGTIQGDGDHR